MMHLNPSPFGLNVFDDQSLEFWQVRLTADFLKHIRVWLSASKFKMPLGGHHFGQHSCVRAKIRHEWRVNNSNH